MELERPREQHGKGSLSVVAIAYVFTFARVAKMLEEDEDFLYEIASEMEPEDGVISVYGLGEDYTPAFTTFGIENLKESIPMYHQQVSPTGTPRS